MASDEARCFVNRATCDQAEVYFKNVMLSRKSTVEFHVCSLSNHWRLDVRHLQTENGNTKFISLSCDDVIKFRVRLDPDTALLQITPTAPMAASISTEFAIVDKQDDSTASKGSNYGYIFVALPLTGDLHHRLQSLASSMKVDLMDENEARTIMRDVFHRPDAASPTPNIIPEKPARTSISNQLFHCLRVGFGESEKEDMFVRMDALEMRMTFCVDETSTVGVSMMVKKAWFLGFYKENHVAAFRFTPELAKDKAKKLWQNRDCRLADTKMTGDVLRILFDPSNPNIRQLPIVMIFFGWNDKTAVAESFCSEAFPSHEPFQKKGRSDSPELSTSFRVEETSEEEEEEEEEDGEEEADDNDEDDNRNENSDEDVNSSEEASENSSSGNESDEDNNSGSENDHPESSSPASAADRDSGLEQVNKQPVDDDVIVVDDDYIMRMKTTKPCDAFANTGRKREWSSGDEVVVRHKGLWYPAKVLDVEKRIRVHYANQAETEDQWVEYDSVMPNTFTGGSQCAGYAAEDKSERVLVRHRGSLHEATVVRTKSRYRVHYCDQPETSFEWVSDEFVSVDGGTTRPAKKSRIE